MKFKYDFHVIRKHISFTFLTQIISCPQAALLGRIIRAPVPYKPSKARDIGVFTHDVLEKAMLKAVEDKKIPAPEEYLKIMTQIRKENPEKEFLPPMSDEKLAKGLQEYHDKEFGHRLSEPVKVEFELPNQELWGLRAKGRVDLQIGKDVVDYKTKAKSTGKKIESSKRMTKLQGCFYNKSLKKDGFNMETFQAHNLIITSKAVTPQIYTYTQAELVEAEQELEDMVKNAVRVMDSGYFMRNYMDMYCPCEYEEFCKDEEKTEAFIKSLNIPKNIY